MNAIDIAPWLAEPWVHRLGWTLIQFLWQGAMIACGFAVVRATAGRALSSRGRYALACGALAMMTVAPVITFAAGASAADGASARWLVPMTTKWDSFMPTLVAVWSTGVLVCAIRLFGGWLAARRLKTVGVRPAPAEWQDTFERLVRRLGIYQRVRLLVSSRVDVPVVVGWLRPVVLVPVGALTGLPAEYITALLAHELAHVARRDYLVNLLQRVAESLLFYHPAVWWVSGQIRVEREMCCDDMAVAAQGDPVVYARALAELDAARVTRRALEMAADGPTLIDRVRRLLGHTLSPWQLLPGPGGLAAIAVLWLVGVVAVTARTDRPVPVTTSAAAPLAQIDGAGGAAGLLATALLGPIGPPPSQSSRPAAPASGRAGAVESSAPPPRSTPDQPSVVRGRITSASTGLPVRNAWVQLFRSHEAGPAAESVSLTVTTDDDGRYELTDVPAGKYSLRARKAGFVDAEYGSRGPMTPGKALDVAAGQTIEKIDLALPIGGVLTGVILDVAGDPIAGVIVSARMAQTVNGVARPTEFDVASDVTDDQGRYRLFGLEWERVFLTAASRNPAQSACCGSDQTAGVTFYPGTLLSSEARTVQVVIGREMTAPPFSVTPSRQARVSGVVTRQDGKPLGLDTVSLQPLGAVFPRGEEARVVDGTFLFPRVAPGEYTVTARSEDGTSMASADVRIEGVDAVVPLMLRPAGRIRGRVVFEPAGAVSSANRSEMFILLRDAGRSAAPVLPVDADWTFDITGLFGRKEFDLQPPPGFGLKDLRGGARNLMEPLEFNGDDISGVEVVLTQRVTVVSGRVKGVQDRTSPGVVIVFPENEDSGRVLRSLRLKVAPVDEEGRYRVEGLLPGRYRAVAVERLAGVNFESFGSLAPDATTVTLAEGDQKVVDLPLIAN